MPKISTAIDSNNPLPTLYNLPPQRRRTGGICFRPRARVRLSVCVQDYSKTQGRPVNVKHDARCVMGKVGGETKNPKRGEI